MAIKDFFNRVSSGAREILDFAHQQGYRLQKSAFGQALKRSKIMDHAFIVESVAAMTFIASNDLTTSLSAYTVLWATVGLDVSMHLKPPKDKNDQSPAP